jgi:hypothetical protein
MPNQALRQTAAAILVPESSLSLGAAAAAELGRWRGRCAPAPTGPRLAAAPFGSNIHVEVDHEH